MHVAGHEPNNRVTPLRRGRCGGVRPVIGVDTEDAARIGSPPGLMADERAAEQPDTDAPEQAVSQPHDKYFYSVFSNEQDAASLLRTCVPRPLADTPKWSTLTRRYRSLRC